MNTTAAQLDPMAVRVPAQPGGKQFDDFEQVDAPTLELLQEGVNLQMNHYGGQRIGYSCIGAQGVHQRLVKLRGADAGRIYNVVDASGGYASACLGTGHPQLRDAVTAAVASASYVTDEVGSLERAVHLRRLFGPGGLFADVFPPGEFHVSGRNSGSEGIELAIRLVLEHNFDYRHMSAKAGRANRRRILAFEGAWHGWTGGVVPLLNRRHYRIGLPQYNVEGPGALIISHIPFGDIASLEGFFSRFGSELAGVIVEPIQGDAGILVPPQSYLRRLSNLCREHGALLVVDEVLTFAKTGNFFSMRDDLGPVPADITVIGKSLGMGVLSTSLVIARRDLAARTCGAVATSDLRPITCSICRAGLDILVADGLVGRSAALGGWLRDALNRELVRPFPELFKEVRGVGLLNGVEVTERLAGDVHRFREMAINNGVYAEFMAGAGRRSGGQRFVFPTLRLAPPLIVTQKELDQVVAGLRATAEAMLRAAGA